MMDEPKPNGHQDQSETETKTSDEAGSSAATVQNMQGSPRADAADNSRERLHNQETPSLFPKTAEAILHWFHRYWDAPREKTKWTDGATVILTLVIAGAALWSAWIFQAQLEEARRASNDLERQLAATDRPWVSLIAVPSTPLVYHNGVISIGFSFSTTNIGRSPAENVSINASLIAGMNFAEWNKRQEGICRGIVMQERTGTVNGYILFPGSPPNSQEIGLELSKGDVDSFWKAYPANIPHNVIPIGLIGCVDYTYESSPIHHQTGVMFELMMLPNKTVIDVSKAPIPPQSIFRMGWPGMKYFAN